MSKILGNSSLRSFLDRGANVECGDLSPLLAEYGCDKVEERAHSSFIAANSAKSGDRSPHSTLERPQKNLDSEVQDVEAKYTRIVCERRFLVAYGSNWKDSVEPYNKRLEDRYIRGTRLRLRVQTDSDTGRRLIKLTKKFESESASHQTVARILLSVAEYDLFARLDADCISKTRHYHNYLGQIFSIDVFEGELAGLLLCEIESEDMAEIMAVHPPPCAGPEVTEDAFFTGGNLCRVSCEELSRKLSLYSAT